MALLPEFLLGSPLFEVLTKNPLSASRHGLSAYIAELLDAKGQPTKHFRADARACVVNALKHQRLLFTVLDAFGKAGIAPIALKGFGLASRIYPNPLVRVASDVDVLVRADRLDEAANVLRRLGLTEHEDPSFADVHEEHHHLAFHGPGGAVVELHFRLFAGFGAATFDETGLWARAVPGELEGRPVLFLSPEDEFVYLAVHAANHAFMRLSWLVDLVQYLRAYPSLDWAQAGREAKRARMAAPVASALRVLQASLGVTLPSAALDAFAVSAWRAPLERQLFSTQRLIDADLARGRLSSFLIRVALVDSPGQAARHLWDGGARFARLMRGA